jgi:hypothetical protein
VNDSTCSTDERTPLQAPPRVEQGVAPQRHTLFDIDAANMTATCFACGEGVAIRRAKRGTVARVQGVNFVCAKQIRKVDRDSVDPGALSRSGRGKMLHGRFRMTEDEYDALWTSQGGRCAICRGLPEPGRMLAVDHDPRCCPASARQTCGLCVRGLVCTMCNWGLGHFLDDPRALMRAAAYVLNGRDRLMPSDVLMDLSVMAFKDAA